MKKKVGFALVALLGLFLFASCSNSSDPVVLGVTGKMTTGTASYGIVPVTGFTVSVVGGTGNYKIYYARTATDNASIALKDRTLVGTCKTGTTFSHAVDGGHVSTGWYYWIWAVDDLGASGMLRCYPKGGIN